MLVIDQMSREVLIPRKPLRIVSLVPSQTELLANLGLDMEVVGITKFCLYPESWHQTKDRIGGTKNINIKKVKSLEPNLIIGNKEENSKADIEELEKIAPVWMSDIFDLDDSLRMIMEIGLITNKQITAENLVNKIRSEFNSLSSISLGKKCAYFIWHNPSYVAGKNTFIDAMLNKMGLMNFTNEERYPIFSQTNNTDPDIIFLSSEPYPFKTEDVDRLKSLFPNTFVKLVDGELFSWYGSRLVHAPAYFKTLQLEISAYFASKT